MKEIYIVENPRITSSQEFINEESATKFCKRLNEVGTKKDWIVKQVK